MGQVKERLDQGQYLTFFIAGEEYALGILRVKEIIEYRTPTRVPQMPLAVRGVINLRGSVVPVVDLAVQFQMGATQIGNRSCFVIVEARIGEEATTMGIVVDSVKQVIDLSASDIEPPPSFGTSVRVDSLLGMGKAEDGFVLILDIDHVLSEKELLAAAELVVAADGTELASPDDSAAAEETSAEAS